MQTTVAGITFNRISSDRVLQRGQGILIGLVELFDVTLPDGTTKRHEVRHWYDFSAPNVPLHHVDSFEIH